MSNTDMSAYSQIRALAFLVSSCPSRNRAQSVNVSGVGRARRSVRASLTDFTRAQP